jgi:hypothetical protein
MKKSHNHATTQRSRPCKTDDRPLALSPGADFASSNPTRESLEIPTSVTNSTGQTGSFRKIIRPANGKSKKPARLSPVAAGSLPTMPKNSQRITNWVCSAKPERSRPTPSRKILRYLLPAPPAKWVRFAESPAPRTGNPETWPICHPWPPEACRLRPKTHKESQIGFVFAKLVPSAQPLNG